MRELSTVVTIANKRLLALIWADRITLYELNSLTDSVTFDKEDLLYNDPQILVLNVLNPISINDTVIIS